MSCHVMSAWVVFGLATLPFRMQVRFHDDIDGSSLARAIYASTGPLLFPLIQGFSRTHTHTHTLPREGGKNLGPDSEMDMEMKGNEDEVKMKIR